MISKSTTVTVVALLILAKWAAQAWLGWLNRGHVLNPRNAIPKPLEGVIDEPTYRKSADYTLAKHRLDQIDMALSVIVLLLVLFSGVLPSSFTAFSNRFGHSAWAMAGFLFLVGFALSLPGVPIEWYHQFRLEERFGFNTTTQKTWWLDRLKGLLLGVVLGYPLLVFILKLVEWTGPRWWLWAWAALVTFQLVM